MKIYLFFFAQNSAVRSVCSISQKVVNVPDPKPQGYLPQRLFCMGGGGRACVCACMCVCVCSHVSTQHLSLPVEALRITYLGHHKS